MHTCMHVFVYVWMHVRMLAYGAQQSAWSICLSSPPYLCFWRQGLTFTWDSPVLLDWLARIPEIYLALPPKSVPPHLAFLLGFWGSNPGPHTCVARNDCIFSLQEDYHKLLTKYAEAENTIDQLRLGAKVLTGWCRLSCGGGAKSGGS